MAKKQTKSDINELQSISGKTTKKIKAIYPPIISDVLDVDSWNNIPFEVKQIFDINNYSSGVEGAIVEQSVTGAQVGLGSSLAVKSVPALTDYFLNIPYDGVKLSSTLRANALEAEKIVTKVIKEQLSFKTNWKKLTTEIEKVTNTVGDVSNIITELNKTGLKHIQGKLSTKEIAAFKKKIKEAQKYVDGLTELSRPSKALKKSYQNVINAVNSKDKDILNGALDNAFNKKINYNNSRVAKTELSRSYSEAFHREIEEDSLVGGYRWLLSPSHPITDQCDAMAEIDNGAGKGVYLKGDAPSIPAHPHCLCMLEPWIIQGGKKPKKYNDAAANKYLGSLSEKKRAQIIGKDNAKYKSNYTKGLKAKGIDKGSFPKRNLLPKRLVEGV